MNHSVKKHITLVDLIWSFKYVEQCGVIVNEPGMEGFILINKKWNKKYVESLFRYLKIDLGKYTHTVFCLFSKDYTFTNECGDPSVKTTNFFDEHEIIYVISMFPFKEEERNKLWRHYRKLVLEHVEERFHKDC